MITRLAGVCGLAQVGEYVALHAVLRLKGPSGFLVAIAALLLLSAAPGPRRITLG